MIRWVGICEREMALLAQARAQFSEACRIRIEFLTGCDPALSGKGVDLVIQCSLTRRF